MNSGFTTLWSRDTWDAARRLAGPGFRFDVLFGGPHQSLPSFSRAKVCPGDWIFPISVRAGALHVLGRMQVAEIVSVDEYRRRRPEQSERVGPFDLAVRLVDEPPDDDHWNNFLASSCVNEAVLGTAGTPLLWDAVVPPQDVIELRYESPRRGQRPIKHLSPDGRVTSIASFQGIYRLSAASTERLAAIVDRTAALPPA